MQLHIGTKQVTAKPMTRSDAEAHLGRNVGGDKHGDGYLVEYEGGYQAWSPKDVFDAAYRPTTGMTFGLAIEALKRECCVQRAGWNGKGLRLALVGNGGCFEHGMSEISTLPYIVMLYPQDASNTPGAVVPWLASQTDMLAEDWQIV